MEFSIGEIEQLIDRALTEGQIKKMCRRHFPEITDNVSGLSLIKDQRVSIIIEHISTSIEYTVTLLKFIQQKTPDTYAAYLPEIFKEITERLEEPQKRDLYKEVLGRELPGDFDQRMFVNSFVKHMLVDNQRVKRVFTKVNAALMRSGRGRNDRPQREVDIPPYLRYLCDRTFQQLDLETTFEEISKKNERKPLIIVIHGDWAEFHSAFISRIKRVSHLKDLYRSPKLEELYNSGTEKINSEALSIDPCRDPRKIYFQNLNVSLERGAKKLFKHNTKSSQPGEPLVISSSINLGLYAATGRELLKQYIEFWNNYQIVSESEPIIICLSIIYDTEKVEWNRLRTYKLYRWWMKRECRNEISKLADSKFAEYENLEGVVLRELDGIEKSEVQAWAKLPDTLKWWKKDQLALENIIDRIYEDHPTNKISMKELDDQLKYRIKNTIS